MSKSMRLGAGLMCVLLAGVGMATGAGAGGRDGEREGERPPQVPAVQFVGHESAITERQFVLVKDEKAWEALWTKHLGHEVPQGPPRRHEVPKVDFSRFMVVGHFNGAGTNCDGEIAQSIEIGETVRVRFEESSFQTASFGPEPDKGVATRSFGMWVIERSIKPVVVERPKAALKGEAVEWETVWRFDGE